MKGIYEFYWDCGRMGELYGMFIADSKEVEDAIGSIIYFGEVLGKHSEIEGALEKDDIELKTNDQKFIAEFEKIIGSGTILGYNPIALYQEQQEEAVY